MPRFLEPLLILMAFLAAFLWSQLPVASQLSLQLALSLVVCYFLLKRLGRSRWHSVLPAENTLETSLLLLATAVLVGNTGGLTSPFLPLFHLLLFVSVLALRIETNLVKLVGLLLFLWASTDHPWQQAQWITFLSLPLLAPLMVFARWELEVAQRERQEILKGNRQLTQQETTALLFLTTFVKPKLRLIATSLSLAHPDGINTARKQTDLLLKETESTIHELDQTTDEISE